MALFESGQFEAVIDLYRTKRPRLLPDERAGEYLVRSLIFLNLQGAGVHLELPEHLADWVTLLQARVEGDLARANGLFAQKIVHSEDAPTFIRRFFLGNYFGLSLDDETIDACLERLWFGAQPRYFALAQQRTPMPYSSVFVSGVPRSGTTALGRVLNTSPEIELYHELYPARLGYTAKMFDPNLLPEVIQARYRPEKRPVPNLDPALRFRGDKRPLFLNGWSITKRNYRPDQIRIIHIVRDPRNVAASYEKRRVRALTGRRNWDADRGSWIAESDMQLNRQLLEQVQQSEFSDSIKVVPFRKAVCDLNTVQDMHDFIGARMDVEAAKAQIDQDIAFLEAAKVEQAQLRLLSQDDRAWYTALAD